MQAINEKNGKKCQTLDIYFAARRKVEKLKIHEKMKENENKRLNQSAEKRIIGLSFNENSFILSKSVKISKKVSKKSCKTLDIFSIRGTIKNVETI